uniref:C-type lectin domain-containing protein n=1 Tax=Colobus angolensis palliatus TaxID=336983 RepID=A0A2K5HTZ9_COLAP
MERVWEAAPGGQAGAEFPMEPVGSMVPGLEQPQVPEKARQPEGPESSPSPVRAMKKAAGAGREPSSEKQLPSPRPGTPRVPPLPMYVKSLYWALAFMAVLLAVSGVVIVVLASRAGARCQPCPPGWVLSEEHCYYLSAEAQAWEASQAFCSAYHATLPLLSHTQDFLGRYPVSRHSWVGAWRGPQGWHWIDEAPLLPQLLPEDGKDNLDINCGALEEGTLVAANCSTPRPWVCAKGTQ